MADVKKTLPPSTAQAWGVASILDSCDGELEQLERETRAACRRLAAGTADGAGCALWERELGLPVREDLPPDVRRALIAIALEGRETCTPERLKRHLGRMLEGEITLTEAFADYGISLAAQVEHFAVASLKQVETVLRQAVPAHLAVSLSAAAQAATRPASGRGTAVGMNLEITTEEEVT
ncbi:MAG: DUF2313 domain-containing protein [Clostridia bacterium]|nr:DUF2313 domain-containing protein [Clostridia bacterium]